MTKYDDEYYYELIEDWKVIWRYADATSIFFYSNPEEAERFPTDYDAFNSDVEAVANAIGACMQASVSDSGITNSNITALEGALSHLWDHVVPSLKEPGSSRETDTLLDFEEVSRGALAWATHFINKT